MNYTKTYHLPQWEKSDRIMMDDFNAAMSNIESGLKKTVQDAAGYASQAQSNASDLAAKAQTAADAAMAARQAAQKTADKAFSPNRMPYSVGSYTGNGTSTTIDLGYRPSLVIITGQELGGEVNYVRGILVATPGIMSSAITFKNTGFSIKNPSETHTPKLNVSGEHYGFIAFQ